ncbi:hypothetical protein [Sulfurimonas sp. HSL-1716]|uniref:hypothetical protein n=1 Tax=Hydrocurvibacter sulfurireducens TaxID=3131937 RepID=UPI0031F9A0DF
MRVNFENLDLIPELLKKIEDLEIKIEKMSPPVNSKKDVARVLDVTPRTVNNYITQGYLQEGVHFHRKGAKMLVFIESAILEFREQLKKGMVKNEKVAV